MEKKKEIWIEKLIRYLLESKWEEYKEEYYEWYRDVELEQNIDSLSELKPFIKWLVENDKIDTSKSKDKNLNGYEIELRIRAVKELVADSEEKTVLYLNLLMLLSISDTPIDFLCEILR